MARDIETTNESEGNKTAARSFNKAQQRFVTSGPVEEKAREAEKVLDGPEAAALAEVEAEGRHHIAEEEEKLSARAYELWEQEGRPLGRDREHWERAEAEMQTP